MNISRLFLLWFAFASVLIMPSLTLASTEIKSIDDYVMCTIRDIQLEKDKDIRASKSDSLWKFMLAADVKKRLEVTDSSIKEIMGLLEDDDLEVRRNAAAVLGTLAGRGQIALPALKKALTIERDHIPQPKSAFSSRENRASLAMGKAIYSIENDLGP